MRERSGKRIVAIEGAECSGKTTILDRARSLESMRDVTCIHELASFVGRSFPLGTGASEDTELALLTINGVLVERLTTILVNGRRALSDRCWISQSVYSQVRRRIREEPCFDPVLFERQERVLESLYPEVFDSLGVVYIKIPPDVSLLRLGSRAGKRDVGHQPDLRWTTIASEEYDSCMRRLTAANRIPIEVIEGVGSRDEVFERFRNACNRLGYRI
jgi:thymidylate kinase